MNGRSVRVTIGVPVHDGERFLERTLTTLKAQTFEDIEILVSDNASSDASVAIASSHAEGDHRIRVLRSAENRGAAWNFNRLVDEASGEMFMWAAADDEFDPDYVAALVAALDEAPDAVLAHPSTLDIDEVGAIIHHWDLTAAAVVGGPADRFLEVMSTVDKCFAVFGMIRIETLRQTGRIGAYSGSDKILLAELALHGRFVHVDRPLFRHREHDGRSMNRYPDERTRPAWFDPDLAGRTHLPYWRSLRGYVEALVRSGARQPSGSAKALAWYVKRWHRALASELLAQLRIDRPGRSRR